MTRFFLPLLFIFVSFCASSQILPAEQDASLSTVTYAVKTDSLLERIDSLYLIALYTDALDEVMVLLTDAQRQGNDTLEIKSYQLTSDLLRAIGDYPGALQYCEKTYMFDATFDNKQILSNTYNLMAAIYFEMAVQGHLDSARHYAEKSVQLAEMVGDSGLICSNSIIIGSVALNQKDFDLARKSLTVAMEIAKKRNLVTVFPLIKWHLAELYEKQGQYTKSEQTALEGFREAKQDSLHVYVYVISDFLRQFYLKQGNKEQSYYFLSELIQSRNRIQMEKTKRQITRLESSLVLAEKEKENHQLRLQDTENQRKLQTTLFLTLFLVAIVIIGIAFLISTIKGKKQLKRANRELLSVNKALQEQKEQTERMALELNNTNATLKKFISVMAHDLKNPFNSILGFADLLKSEFQDMTEEEKMVAIHNIHKASMNAFTLLEQLLEWARMQTKNYRMQRDRLNLSDVIKTVAETLHASIVLKNLTLDIRMQEDLFISGDINMVQAVFRNLLSNAVKFTPETGRIVISGIRENNALIIRVTDSGIGIAPEHIHKLFSMDEQLTMPGTNNEKGTGLGLILCREYMEQHQGTISVTSTPGKGSTFTVTFPEE